jgi:rubrerythrin
MSDENEYYYAYEARRNWYGTLNKGVYKIIIMLEEMLSREMIEPDEAQYIINILGDYLGIEIGKIMLVGKYGVIIPYSNSVEKVFGDEPNTMAIYGERSAGKTVASWTFAFNLFWRLGTNTEIHVYGDIDGISKSIKKSKFPPQFKPFQDAIIEHYDYNLPPIDPQIKKIILFNELGEELLSKNAMTNLNKTMNLLFFRVRHQNEWVISNIIRPSSFEATLRDTSMIKVIKPLYGDLMANIEQYFPSEWKNIIRYASKITKKEGIVIYPLMNYGGGMTIELYKVNPPKFLLNAIERAQKNTELMIKLSQLKSTKIETKEKPEKKGIKLKCPHCNYIWTYTGKMSKIAICPSCGNKVKIPENVVEESDRA